MNNTTILPDIAMNQVVIEHTSARKGSIVELIYRDEVLFKVTVKYDDGEKVQLSPDEFYAWVGKDGGYWVCGL